MKAGTIGKGVGLTLIVAALTWYVWPRRNEEAGHVVASLRTFEAAAGDPTACAKACGPRTRQWMRGLIQAAMTENRAALVNRDFLDMVTILDLRRVHVLSQLQAMKPEDGLKFYFRESESKPAHVVDKVRIEGDEATARLASTSSKGKTVNLGTDRLFTRENGVWYFEPYVLHQRSMQKVAGSLDPTQRSHLAEDGFRDANPPFDPATWEGPRR